MTEFMCFLLGYKRQHQQPRQQTNILWCLHIVLTGYYKYISLSHYLFIDHRRVEHYKHIRTYFNYFHFLNRFINNSLELIPYYVTILALSELVLNLIHLKLYTNQLWGSFFFIILHYKIHNALIIIHMYIYSNYRVCQMH